MSKNSINSELRITWLDINSSYSHSSLALPAIEAQQPNAENIVWNKVSGTINSVISNIIEELITTNPDVVAYTAWIFTHDIVLSILARYKQINPNVIVIGGGPEYLGDNSEFLNTHRYINVVARGEGEEIFHQWTNSVNDKENWKDINGLCYLDADNNYQDNGIAKVADYASLKFPEESKFFDWDKPFIQIESTRGCFNSCAFCVSGADKPVRSLDINSLRNRLLNAKNHGIKDIRLLDRTFNGAGNRAIELLSLFEEFAGVMQFHLEVHPALFTTKIREKIESLPIGLLHVEAGVQSLTQQVLDKSKRHGKIEDVIDGLKFLCNNGGFQVHSDLIAGLPYYTLSMIYADINVLSSIKCDEIQLELLKLLPGTFMRNNAKELGIIYSPLTPYEVMQTDAISYTEIGESRRVSRVLDMYYNCDVWRELIQKLIINDSNFVLNFTSYLTKIDMVDQPLSMERRGILLHEYCKLNHNNMLIDMTISWIKGGLSLKKGAGEGAKSFIGTPPLDIENLMTKNIRLYNIELGNSIIWFGYDRSISHSTPIFVKLGSE